MSFRQQFPQENAKAVDVVLFCRTRIDVPPVFWWNVGNSSSGTLSPRQLV